MKNYVLVLMDTFDYTPSKVIRGYSARVPLKDEIGFTV
jgi:hypothetical protein